MITHKNLASTPYWQATLFGISVVISTAVLVGWGCGIPLLKSVLPGYVTMKANTAVCLLLMASAVWIERRERKADPWKFFGLALVLVSMAVAGATLAEYIWNFNAGIDELLFADPDGRGGKFPPGRFAPITGLNLILLGIGALLLYNPWKQFPRTAQFLAMITFLISFQALVGYACGIPYTFGKAFYTQMALHATVLFICTSCSLLLSREEWGLMEVFSAKTIGGATARVLILSAVLVPPVVTWLQIQGQKAGFYDENFGTLLKVIGNVVFFSVLVWRSAYALHESDKERQASELARNEVLISERGAKEASRLKSDFLANMSHEIRTPLNGIIGMTGILIDSGLNPEQKEQAEVIQRSGDSLLALINDILDFSKIEAGKLSLEEFDFGPRSLLMDVQKTFEPLALKKSLVLKFMVHESVPNYLRSDPSRFRQVVMNLVGNALKFTKKGTVVLHATAMADGDQVRLRIEVRDSGIGISQDDMKNLFHPFTQADSSTTRKFGGTGLGLSISKRIVEIMNGELGASSEAGEGSVFWFVVPMRIGTKPKEELSAMQAHPVRSANPYRVLLAEDNQVNLMIAKKMLEKLGFRVDAVANGKEALAALAERPFDLVLMDCQMPEMDGYEATGMIRAHEEERIRRIPVIAMTANAMVGDKERCLNAGMDDYVSKPISVKSLEALLANWIVELERRAGGKVA